MCLHIALQDKHAPVRRRVAGGEGEREREREVRHLFRKTVLFSRGNVGQFWPTMTRKRGGDGEPRARGVQETTAV